MLVNASSFACIVPPHHGTWAEETIGLECSSSTRESRPSPQPSCGGAFGSFLDHLGDCVAIVDRDGSTLFINESGRRVLEDTSYSDGRMWADLWPAELHQTIADGYARAARGEVARYDGFSRAKDGVQRWSNFSVTMEPAVNEQAARYLILYRPIADAEMSLKAFEATAAELKHRLRNSYAVVSSLLAGFARGSPDREEFAHDMSRRLSALGASQTLLMEQRRSSIDAAMLLTSTLEPFEQPDCRIDAVASECLLIDHRTAEAVSLVLGELAINSCKHGALSSSGSIRTTACNEDGVLLIRWSEFSTKPVRAHSRPGGQGIELIRRIIHAARGTISVEWRSDGLDVILQFAGA